MCQTLAYSRQLVPYVHSKKRKGRKNEVPPVNHPPLLRGVRPDPPPAAVPGAVGDQVHPGRHRNSRWGGGGDGLPVSERVRLRLHAQVQAAGRGGALDIGRDPRHG